MTAVEALARDRDPAVAALARRDFLGGPAAPDAALGSPVVRGLLAGLQEERWLQAPYQKWRGAHWRLVSLAELGVPAGHPPAVAACDRVLDFWVRPRRLAAVPVVDGRARRCASQEGNAVAVACRLGLAGDDRVRLLVERLVDWQWPDGGWNCDARPEAHHSSLHETLIPLWGLTEFRRGTEDSALRAAATAAAEFLLRHRVVFSCRTGAPVDPVMLRPHYPPYWRYDLLQSLLVLTRAGHGADPRTAQARRILDGLRRADGTWRAGRRWWRPPDGGGGGREAVDWAGVADRMVTLNAVRVGEGVPATGDP